MGLNSTYNPIIGFPRHTPDFTMGGGSYESGFPASNAGDARFARVARTTDATNANTVLTATSSTIKPVRIFGVAAHNMTIDAEYKLTVYSDTGLTTELYNTGRQKVWPNVYSYAGRNWYTPYFWTGQYSPAEIAGQIPFLPILLPQTYNIRGVKLEIFDASNPDGYVEIGLFEIASGWQPSVGVAYASQFGYRSYTELTKLRGGLDSAFVEQPSYVFEGEIPAMNENEVWNNAMEMRRRYDIHTAFIWMAYPTRQTTWLKSCKMVKLVGDSLMSHAARNADRLPLILEEYKG